MVQPQPLCFAILLITLAPDPAIRKLLNCVYGSVLILLLRFRLVQTSKTQIGTLHWKRVGLHFGPYFFLPFLKLVYVVYFFFYIFEWHFFTLLHECFKLETSLKTNFQFIWWNKKKWIFSCEIFKENCCEFFVKKKLLISSERELPFLGCFFSTTIASHVRHDKS